LKLHANEVGLTLSVRVLASAPSTTTAFWRHPISFPLGFSFLLCLLRAMLGLDKGHGFQRTFVYNHVCNRNITILQ
jgi:hypothetical protein